MKGALVVMCVALLAVLVAGCTPQPPKQISLYYYNPELDKDSSGNIMCSEAGLVAVTRQVAPSISGLALVEETIRLLISGDLTAEETAQGITTEFPLEGFSLQDASLTYGDLTLTFVDPNFRTSGGSCRVGVLWAQIEETALQLPGIEQVGYQPADLFQP